MLRIKIIVASLMLHSAGTAICQKRQELKPICQIQLTTMQDNTFKGLLLSRHDSVLEVYPGKKRDWNRRRNFKPVLFNFSRIKEIVICRSFRGPSGGSPSAGRDPSSFFPDHWHSKLRHRD